MGVQVIEVLLNITILLILQFPMIIKAEGEGSDQTTRICLLQRQLFFSLNYFHGTVQL